MRTVPGSLIALGLCALFSACSDNNNRASTGSGGQGGGGGSTPESRCATARVAQSQDDLVPGPLARGVAGDLVIENRRLRAVVQKGGRNWYNISQFGGNLIDAMGKNADGSFRGGDQFEELALGTNIESSPNYQTVEVLDAGGENLDGSCRPAMIRAQGPDDLLDFVNGSSAIRDITISGVPAQFPPSADDVDLPLDFETTYTLDADQNWIRMDTRMLNPTDSEVRLYLVEYINGSGEIEGFQHGYGFGEPLLTAPCDRCNYIAFAGHEGGAGVSYGVIHDIDGSTSVSVSGVSVLFYGRDVFTVGTTLEPMQEGSPTAGPNFTVPANGDLTFTRYFAVGDGTVSSIVDARNQILELETGTIRGLVTDANGPVAGAEIAMLSSERDGYPPEHGPVLNVVDHFRTDASGRYAGSYPPGDYELRLNMPGRLAGDPDVVGVTITADAESIQDFSLPLPGRLRLRVADSNDTPIAAKVQLIGTPLGPDAGEPLNEDQLLGSNLLDLRTGVFGDADADKLAPGIALAEFAVLDTGTGAVTVGDTGELPVEPGSYVLSVSRGPRYSEFTMPVTIEAGELTEINARIVQIIETPGRVFGDFHVHSFNSPDAEVTNRERVATYLSEDMDFFTPSDHDIRVDFAPVLADMQVDGLIATAPSAEVTTFDYGHFNFWPVRVETDSPDDDFPNNGHSRDPKIGRGSVDWGGQAPLGEDFPSAGNYSVPPSEIGQIGGNEPSQSGREVVKQINHIESHFGGSGLGIDTGQTPPVSTVAASARRLDPGHVHPTLGGHNFFGDNYDSLELWIGVDGIESQAEHLIEENLGDWFNLLNQGRHHTGMANSDTHDRRLTSLHTRNLISVPASLLREGAAAADLISADPHTVGDSVRAGLSTMTNAPILSLRATAGGNSAGLSVDDDFGTQDSPLSLAQASDLLGLQIDVQSAAWAAYDQILIFTNGDTQRHVDETTGLPTTPARYAVCAPPMILNLGANDFSRTSASVNGAQRFESSTQVNLPAPGATDYWVVVMVRGTSGESPTLWPVVPNDFEDADGNLDNRSADDGGVRALAISNPIYIDADGDGQWTPPGVLTHQGTFLSPDQCASGVLAAQ